MYCNLITSHLQHNYESVHSPNFRSLTHALYKKAGYFRKQSNHLRVVTKRTLGE